MAYFTEWESKPSLLFQGKAKAAFGALHLRTPCPEQRSNPSEDAFLQDCTASLHHTRRRHEDETQEKEGEDEFEEEENKHRESEEDEDKHGLADIGVNELISRLFTSDSGVRSVVAGFSTK